MLNDLPSSNLQLPLLPLKNVVVFPRTIVNLTVGRTRSIHALNLAMTSNRHLVVVAQTSDDHDDPLPEDLYHTGTLVEVKQVRRQPDGSIQVEVEALYRVNIGDISQDDPCLVGDIQEVEEQPDNTRETDALMRHLSELFNRYASLNNKVPGEAPEHIRAARNAGYMADLLAAHLLADVHDRQHVLELNQHGERLQYMAAALTNEIDVLETDQRVRNKVRAALDKNQREFYLREQLKAIHDELAGEGGNEMAELRDKLQNKGLPTDVLARCLKEVSRLERMPSVSPEFTVLRNYIDWVLSLPWSERTPIRIHLPLAEQLLPKRTTTASNRSKSAYSTFSPSASSPPARTTYPHPPKLTARATTAPPPSEATSSASWALQASARPPSASPSPAP